MENKNNEQEEIKGCIFPAIIVIMVMIMAFVTITCVNNRLEKVEATQDTILKTIRGYDWSSTAVVDSTVDSTATDSSVVADDEYCEDCDDEQQDKNKNIIVADDGTKIDMDYAIVYVCSGRYARKFHIDANCIGLQNCRGTIEGVLLKDVKRRGLTVCRRCIQRLRQ